MWATPQEARLCCGHAAHPDVGLQQEARGPNAAWCSRSPDGRPWGRDLSLADIARASRKLYSEVCCGDGLPSLPSAGLGVRPPT